MFIELVYADYLVLMIKTLEGLRNKCGKLRDFGSMASKVNLGKIKVMVCGSITNFGLSKSNVCPCNIYSLRIKANSVFFVPCDMWVNSRCAGVEKNFACRRYEGKIEESVEQEKM